ncbi:Hypothetical protein R9X50_00253500 [Acrodontium crateriforme]|uniref:Phosphatidylinositol-specific phospholipase C X domain-containing protein n=1 Tax=Acrodontium crateriforme TaxID=150365 RepID=A0AAQ3M758_9PEZI|nr:Hypothetical protein R9X50_00253500 [Acrodontium crateriforme]
MKSPDTIIIRNHTRNGFRLKIAERLEPEIALTAESSSLSVSSFATNFTAFLGNVTRSGARPAPTLPSSPNKVDIHVREDVDLRIDPFASCNSNLRIDEHVLRLTLHGQGDEKWSLDISRESIPSRSFIPLTKNAENHGFFALFNGTSSVLALFEDLHPQSWMKLCSDETALSALSIPGTHNSPTCYTALPSVRCQAVSVIDQLRNGARFLDVRVQPARPMDPTDSTLNLVHGAFPISLTGPKRFDALLAEIENFLTSNPSETVILSLKREGTGDATDQQLATMLHDHYTSGSKANLWYTEPRIPTLRQVRGKIVLFRRFALPTNLKTKWHGRGWGLNAENWKYNTTNSTSGDVCVQDLCEVLETVNIDTKIRVCCQHFERAAARPKVSDLVPGPLYLNFLSASYFWKVGCWPERIAVRVHPAVVAFLCERHRVGDGEVGKHTTQGDGGVGIVVCDWVGKGGDWDLVRCILAMNSELLMKQNARK